MDNKLKRIGINYIEFIIEGFIVISVGAILPVLKEDRMLSYAFAGALVSAHSIGNFFSSFVSGFVTSKFGARKMITFFSFFMIIAYALIAFTRNNILLYLAILSTGIARGAITNFSNKEINDIAVGDARLMNGLHAMFSIGAFLFPLILTIMSRTGSDGYMKSIYMMLAIGIFGFILYMFYPYNESKTSNSERITSTAIKGFGFFKEKIFILTTLILFLYQAAEQATIGWLITYFKDTGLLPDSIAGLSSSIQWFMILIGRIVVIILLTKISKKLIYMSMAIGFIAFCALLIFAKTPALILIGIAGFGFSMAGIFPTTASLAGEIIDKYELAWSFILTLGSVGAIIMPSVVGFLSNSYGITVGMISILVVTLITVIFMIYRAVLIKD